MSETEFDAVADLIARLKAAAGGEEGILAEAAAMLAEIDAHNQKLSAIVKDKLADTRLLNMGPGDKGFGMELMGGPIPYIAEYLAQMMGCRDEGRTPSNYVQTEVEIPERGNPSLEVRHHEFGWFILTMQRKNGKTPHQFRKEAEARAERAVEALKPFAEGCRQREDGALEIDRNLPSSVYIAARGIYQELTGSSAEGGQ